ncbi:MAG: hypothetical protein Q7T05_06510, partial [Dehalococcoidia bacterium]|nr:hypothetical protein [Dehalococcoidia bacterium]
MTHRISQAKTLFLTISLTVAIMAALAPSFALAIPQFPTFYYGTVTVVGPEGRMPAPAGSSIGATVGAYDVTPVKVTVGLAGKYGGPALTDDKLLVQDAGGYSISAGDIVSFYDNGVQANESSTFESGKVKQQDLTVNDTEGPTAPGNLKRSTEPNVNQPSFTWDLSTDRLSGVSSYAVSLDKGDWTWLGNVTSWSAPAALKDGDHTIDVAARDGHFSLWLALLTLLGGAAIHIGLNTANDIFDALSGADEANYTPTQFSGGSRVIQRGL